jgi:hypothetical protein
MLLLLRRIPFNWRRGMNIVHFPHAAISFDEKLGWYICKPRYADNRAITCQISATNCIKMCFGGNALHYV